MNRLSRFCLRFVAPMTLLMVGVGVAISMRGVEKAPEPTIKDPPRPALEVVHPVSYSGPVSIEAHGVATPHREVVLSSQISGEVIFTHPALKTGCTVRAGEVLVRIDARPYELESQLLRMAIQASKVDREQAEQELLITKSKLDLAKDQAALHRDEYHRSCRASKSRAISESQVDQDHQRWLQSCQQILDLKAAMATLKSNRHRAEIELSRRQFELEKAQLEIEQTVLTAPFDGMIVLAHVEAGASVNPGDRLVAIEDTASIEVSCSLVSEQLHRFSRCERVEAKAANYELPKLPVLISYGHGDQSHIWQGSLSRCEGRGFDEKTRTVPCRILVDQPRSDTGALLRRGMFVRVSIQLDEQTPMLAVPLHALRAGGKIWWLDGGRLEADSVRIATVTDHHAVIYNDAGQLNDRTEIVTSNLEFPRFGAAMHNVQLVRWKSPAETSSVTYVTTPVVTRGRP